MEIANLKKYWKDGMGTVKDYTLTISHLFSGGAQRITILGGEPMLVGISSMTVCLVTNPIDLVKTRLQLQGELKHRNAYDIKYRNVFSAFRKIGQIEGLQGLQKGLLPAMMYQFLSNLLRTLTYKKADESGLLRDYNDRPILWRRAVIASFGGMIGTTIASPFYMAKIQLQTRAGCESLAVGYQHIHTKTRWVLFALPRCPYGYCAGIFQGCSSAALRVSVASFSQMFTFTYVQAFIRFLSISGISDNSFKTAVLASVFSSVVVTLTMNPFDVISTRMYNQETRTYYSSIRDCISKTFEREGVYGFYKGGIAQYLRIAPHTILTLLLWENFTRKGNEVRFSDVKGISVDEGPESETVEKEAWWKSLVKGS